MAEAEARRPAYAAAKEDDEGDQSQDNSDKDGEEDTEEDDEGAEVVAEEPQNEEAERLRRVHAEALCLSKAAADAAARAQAELERAPKEIERRVLRSGGTLQGPAAVNAHGLAEELARRTSAVSLRREAEAALLGAEAEAEAVDQRANGAPAGPWVSLSGPARSRSVRARR